MRRKAERQRSPKAETSHVQKGRALLVRFVWLNISPKSARMEQFFSADGGKTWETNWVCELSR